MSNGFNTDVEHRGRVYHVQTENAKRRGQAVETLIFEQGRILVRMTASWQEVAARADLPKADLRQAVELQHWELVRKIHRGMLDDNPPPRVRHEEAAAAVATHQVVADLDQRLDEVCAERRAAGGVRRLPLSDWWHRRLKRVSVVVRF